MDINTIISRGTTPLHEFTIPADIVSEQIAALHILYKQHGILKLCKTLEDVTINENIISVRLSQEDTFLLHCSSDVEIQIRIRTLSGDVANSDIMIASVEKCLEDEVI